MKRRVISLLLCSLPLLTAMTCDDDYVSTNDYKVRVTPENTLAVGDTLWVKGMVSTKGYDNEKRDSIHFDYLKTTEMGVYKLIKPTSISDMNAADAFDKFEIAQDLGILSINSGCQTNVIRMEGEEFPERSLYIYRVGFVAKEAGDFFIKTRLPSEIVNEDYHPELLVPYAFPVQSSRIFFKDCNSDKKVNTDKEKTVYFFKVQ